MSSKDDDLTRIEDLSEYLHEDEEDDVSLESQDDGSFLEMEKESFGDNTTFIQIPDELNEDNQEDELSEDFSSEFEEGNSFEEASFDTQEDTFEQDSFDTEDFTAQEFALEDSPLEEETPSGTEFFERIDEETEIEAPIATSDPVLEPITEEEAPIVAQAPIEAAPAPVEAPKNYTPQENFKDLNQTANNMSFSDLSIEGNPPYSIVISNIKYSEDVEEILSYLREFKIIQDNYIEDTKNSLERGVLLIPRLSEYSAIILCHKLRKLNVDISMDLTKKIQDTSSYESIDNGLVSKKSIFKNRTDFIDLKSKQESEVED